MQLDGNVSAKQSIQGTLYKIDTIHLNTYQIAVQNGFEGTVDEWLASLKGEKGDTGATGAAGADGKDGADGHTPVLGTDYFTESDKAEMVESVLAALPVYEHCIKISGGSVQRGNLHFSIFNNSPERFTDLTSAINGLLDGREEITIPAQGVVIESADFSPTGFGSGTIMFVNLLSVDREDTGHQLTSLGTAIIVSNVPIVQGRVAHRISEVYPSFDLIVSDSTYSYFYDHVRQIV